MDVKHQTDYNLVNQYLLGDEQAGEQLYLQVIPIVRKYVHKKTSKSMLSDDENKEIVSTILFKSVEILDRFTGQSSFITFVLGIANNIIKQAYRKHIKQANIISFEEIQLETTSLLPAPYASPIYHLGKNPVQVVIEKEQAEALLRAYNLLSEEYQQIILLRLQNKVPVKIVSQMIGKSEVAIDSLSRRAIKKFRENYIKIYFGATESCNFVDI